MGLQGFEVRARGQTRLLWERITPIKNTFGNNTEYDYINILETIMLYTATSTTSTTSTTTTTTTTIRV